MAKTLAREGAIALPMTIVVARFRFVAEDHRRLSTS
jgi:hypothetical protein